MSYRAVPDLLGSNKTIPSSGIFSLILHDFTFFSSVENSNTRRLYSESLTDRRDLFGRASHIRNLTKRTKDTTLVGRKAPCIAPLLNFDGWSTKQICEGLFGEAVVLVVLVAQVRLRCGDLFDDRSDPIRKPCKTLKECNGRKKLLRALRLKCGKLSKMD